MKENGELGLVLPWSCTAGMRKKKMTLLMKKLPCEAYKFVDKNCFKSQLSIAGVRARFVLDFSRVCFTSALTL